MIASDSGMLPVQVSGCMAYQPVIAQDGPWLRVWTHGRTHVGWVRGKACRSTGSASSLAKKLSANATAVPQAQDPADMAW